jgi:peptide/nickel transport system permease protein
VGIRRFTRRSVVLVGVVVLFAEVTFAVLYPLLSSADPTAQDLLNVLASPSSAHPLGTDELGRDILVRLAIGAGVSLQVGVFAVVLALVPGVLLGLVVGYTGGLFDEAIMRVLDALMAFPSLVLALTVVAILGPGLTNAMIAIAIASVPSYVRMTRGQVLSARENDYILAVESVGARQTRILIRHVLPNVVSPVLVLASLGVGFAILTESGLSFLGLGVQPPTPSWGSMISVGFQYLDSDPWYAMAPAAMIFLAVLGFNLLGDGLRDLLDPYSRPTR